ncbi:MAG: beta-ketoacyl-ACP synthase II [Myxococcales bacterium]|nr:beta-ketoacyl-ACP synthase II [Myxococcales bacterium]
MRRVVVTGVGAVSPGGLTADESWRAAVAGRSGIATITRFDAASFPCRIAGEVRGFDPERWIERRRVREMDRFIHLAIAAADEAIRVAGFDPPEAARTRVATIVGVGMCGLEGLEQQVRTLHERGPRRVSPYFIPSVIANLAPGQISMRWGLRGPSYTITSACASGAHAIGEALHAIRAGVYDAAVVGGAEAAVTPVGVAGFCAMRALSTRNEEPERASRPFDVDRDGFVMGEGAGMLVLETEEAARARGAPILAEVLGYGASADAHHLTQPAPEGEGAQRAMRAALEDGRTRPDEVEYINAHGTSTPAGDVQEIEAIRHVFGEHATRALWVSSTKGVTGHLLGAAGGLEAVLSVLALRDGIVPPTVNLDRPDPATAGVDLVPHEARRRPLRRVMSNSFGFGGTNVALLFGRYEGG